MRLRLMLLILAACGVATGLGWWIHPGAGVVAGSLLLGLIALFHDDGKGRK